MRYADLAQRHPKYNAERWRELDELYEGGYRILDNVGRYLAPCVGENSTRYAERLAAASYLNHLGPIVDYFTSALFTEELALVPKGTADEAYYTELSEDVDRRRTPLASLLCAVLTTALVKRRALVAVDFPTTQNDAPNLAAEDAAGLSRAYAFEVPLAELVDWEYDDRGRFVFAVLHRQTSRRASLGGSRALVCDEFKVWIHDVQGVRWELYRSAPHRASEALADDDDVPLVASGNATFPTIPLLELEVPPGLWIGNKLGPIAKEHFQRRSSLNAAENKSLFAIPYVKLGPEISAPGEALPSEVQQDPNRGQDPRAAFHARGYVVIGSDDDIGFAEPAGHAYELVDKQLEKLIDEMYRVTHQMAQSVTSTTTALGRSGTSKTEDGRATETVLKAFGGLVRALAKELFDLIAAARGEGVTWTPHGLDSFQVEDRAGALQEALAVDTVGIPSPTFRTLYKTRLARVLVGRIPPQTEQTIRDEIESAVQHEGELKTLMDTPDDQADREPGEGSRPRGRGGAPPARKAKRASPPPS